jgi:hypothetical protein
MVNAVASFSRLGANTLEVIYGCAEGAQFFSPGLAACGGLPWVTVTKKISSLQGNNKTMMDIGFHGVCRSLSGNHPLARSITLECTVLSGHRKNHSEVSPQ